jgi:hypothetical protein
MFWQTLMIPILGLVAPILSPRSDQWPAFPLVCGGLWLVIFPIAVVYKRWDLERQLKSYKRLNRMIKTGAYQRIFSFPLLNWTQFMMNAERRRFFAEGYPQDEEIKWPLLEVSQKLADNSNSVTKWFSRQYPHEQILYASAATVLEVQNRTYPCWSVIESSISKKGCGYNH